MRLYLLRHAEAVALEGSNFIHDSERPLTEEGLKRMKEVAKAMRLLKLSFDLILSSPFVRARRTAECVAIEFKEVEKLQFTQHLACGGDAEALVRDLAKSHSKLNSILLVGHEPQMSRLISMLLAGHLDMAIHFRKASLAALTVEKPVYSQCAVLEWLLTSKQMSKMAV
jgi:phosphohistidine phosphatase